MKRRITLVFAGLLLCSGATRGYDLITDGKITANTTWPGSVLVTGDVTVPAALTLTIQPGTTVEFNPKTDTQAGGSNGSRCELLVYGVLNASGTQSSPILLTARNAGPAKAPGDWYGIEAVGGTVALKFVTVEYAVNGLYAREYDTDGVTPVPPSSCTLEDSTFSQCSGRGVLFDPASLGAAGQTALRCKCVHSSGNGFEFNAGTSAAPRTLACNNCSFTNNSSCGLSCGDYSTAALTTCEISDNGSYGIYATTYVVAADCKIARNRDPGVSVGNSGTILQNCTLSGNSSDGAYLPDKSTATNCAVLNNSGRGIWFSSAVSSGLANSYVVRNAFDGVYLGGGSGTTNVQGCSILNNNPSGVALDYGTSFGSFSGNLITANGVGISIDNGSATSPETIAAGNDIRDNNSYEISNQGRGAVVATGNYFGAQTYTELAQGVYNLTKIYDSLDDSSVGEVAIATPYVSASLLTAVTASLSGATVNVAYSATLAASGGTAPYTWSLVGSSLDLPPGIAIGSTGTVSGTPTQVGTWTLVLKAVDAASKVCMKEFTFTVSDPASVPGITNISPACGPLAGGTAVTITGTRFGTTGTVLVKFGGYPATNVTVASATSLTCQTPAGSQGHVDVVVTNPDGQSAIVTGGFNYSSLPAPTLATVDPAASDAAGGAAVTLAGANFVSGATVSFGGGAATSVAFVDATKITCTNPAHAAGTVDVAVTNPDGQVAIKAGGFAYTCVATPTFNPAAGTYGSAQSVTISCATSGASIYYTTDGSTPGTSSKKYSGAINLSTTTTLNAYATAAGMSASPVASATYTFNFPLAATPTFSPAPGTYASAQWVTIATTTSGATIYYTTDGTTPTASSTQYTGAINVAATKTIKAYAVNAGMGDSAVATANYTIIPVVATPAFSPPPGTYVGTLPVTISCATAGATIYYTTDGSPPTPSSAVYFSPINVAKTATFKAYAVQAGLTPSAVATGTYTFLVPVITSVAPVTAPVGQAFTYQITASNNPASYNATGLPEGLSVNTTTGLISGTPAAAGQSSVIISATSAAGTGSAKLTLAIIPLPPCVSGVTASLAYATTGMLVSFYVTATQPDGNPMTNLTWDFGDNTTTVGGSSVTHVFSPTADSTFNVTVTANDGGSNVTTGTQIKVYVPASGGSGQPTPNANAAATDVASGASVSVASTDGGMLVLQAGLNGGALPPGYTATTYLCNEYGETVAAVQGTQPVMKVTTPGIYVAVVALTDAQGNPAGTVKLALPISATETGESVGTLPPSNLAISAVSLKGKLLFSPTKLDAVSFKGTVVLPAGLDLSQNQKLSVSLGNVVDTADLNPKGQAKAGEESLLKNVAVKYPKLAKPATKTSAGQQATVSFTLSAPQLDALGFGTEGISKAGGKPNQSVTRTLQAALVLGGTAYRANIISNWKLSKKGDSGQLTGPVK